MKLASKLTKRWGEIGQNSIKELVPKNTDVEIVRLSKTLLIIFITKS